MDVGARDPAALASALSKFPGASLAGDGEGGRVRIRLDGLDSAALNKALATPDMKERLAQGASESLGPSTPAQADAFGQAERAKWVPFIRALRIDLN